MTAHNARYLAIDPGKMNGWATFNEQGSGITMGQCDVLGFTSLIG
jgi:hypothetical protein